MSDVKLFGKRVLIRPRDSAAPRYENGRVVSSGEVVAVGNRVVIAQRAGADPVSAVQVGQVVLYEKDRAMLTEIDGEDLFMVDWADVLGILS